MKKTGFITSPDYLKHDTGNHPEHSSRLQAISQTLEEKNIFKHLISITPSEASVEQISLIHDLPYIEMIADACSKGEKQLDADTVISQHSYHVALLAAGGVIGAIDRVLSGNIDNAFCAVRPPGHHAEQNRAMGFCLFNNAAIGARYAIRHQGIERVFILDWDVHHGNGTQNAFYNDSQVYYASLHQSRHYPGTGLKEEKGAGEGRGYTLNIPLAADSGDEQYLSLLKKEILPFIHDYNPGLIILSAGFDGHKDDPLSSISLTSSGFRQMTEQVMEAAAEVCGGKIVSVLEGGYHLKALGESVAEHISALSQMNNL